MGEWSRMGGNAQRFIELFQTPKFLLFLPRNSGIPVLQTTTSLESNSYKIWLEKILTMFVSACALSSIRRLAAVEQRNNFSLVFNLLQWLGSLPLFRKVSSSLMKLRRSHLSRCSWNRVVLMYPHLHFTRHVFSKI